ncbi:MAG TPA: DUF881 domain-containing protein [Clostridia bacterium]|nr:DUF881 domain-containing protein [Clostridia bacterium]
MDKDRVMILTLALMILGIVIAIQSKSIFEHNKQNTTVDKKIASYTNELDKENGRQEELNQRLDKLEKEKEALLKKLIKSKSDSTLKDIKKELDKTKLAAGLTDVEGHGIVIRLEDALPKDVDDKNILLIHDTDMLKIINELKKSGAQAISVNDERILNTSELVCAGPTILINKNRYPPPYVIRAIGDADKMYSTVDNSQRVYLMRQDGIRISIDKSSDIDIPKYAYNIDELITGLEVVNK